MTPAFGVTIADATVGLLVTANETASPRFRAELVAELEKMLGRRVQVVTEEGLYWLLRRRILREAIPL